MVRDALESLYAGRCDIISQQEVFDPVTKQTSFESVTVVANQPCRLSFKTITMAQEGTGATRLVQVIKVFMSPEIEVKAGSRLVITQSGKTAEYKASGEPAIYSNHQEIILELAGDFA
ncbi:MAG: hypothetical protein IJC05_04985 [Phascolarctobacterium sp.]|nr:hypothetical protein [Phascolarctobacterium sp.]